MKNLLKFAFSLLIIAGVFYSCSNEIETDTENLSLKISDFENHLSNYKNSSASRNTGFKNQLDYTSDYEITIYNLITKREVKPTVNKLAKDNYSNPTEFDKLFVETILNSFQKDDISVFFDKLSYYQTFVDENIKDLLQKDYLNKTVEQFKWIKYSINSVQKPLNNIAHRYNEGCFDDCMESSISEALDDANWIDWAIFLASAAETTAGWAASCIWDCHF